MSIYYFFSGFDKSGGFPDNIANSLRKEINEWKLHM